MTDANEEKEDLPSTDEAKRSAQQKQIADGQSVDLEMLIPA